MKKAKKYLILLFAALAVTAFVLSANYAKRTVENDEQAAGNTPGNLYNSGLFCRDGDTVFFSNPLDEGAIYSMSLNLDGFRKIKDDKAAFLNVSNAYLIYARHNYDKEGVSVLGFSTAGLYRISKKNGKSTKQLSRDAVGQVLLYGNYVFYQHYDSKKGLELYRTGLDGSDNKLVRDDAVVPGSVNDGLLCFAGTNTDHNIYGMDTVNLDSSLLYEGNCYMPVITDDYIYFISLSNDYNLARIPKEGGKGQLLVTERIYTYNMSDDGRYLVYQIDGGQNNRLECLDLETMETTVAADGNYSYIHVIGDMVFYQSFEDGTIQYFRWDSPQSSVAFTPPVL